MKTYRRYLLPVCAALVCACAAKKPQAIFLSPDFKEPMTVAVLPFENETTDLDAVGLYRQLFATALLEKGYKVIPTAEVDEKLREMGITQGGQLGAFKNADLQQKLDAEALVFGNLKEAKYLTVGIKKQKKATGYAALYRKDVKLWEDEKSYSKSEYSLNPVSAIQKQLAGKLAETALSRYSGHPLYQFIEQTVYLIQETMPGTRVEKSGW
ncbi:MAG: DUF799 family lipoprotein [Elusimicrobia bacterium]|nr:DUF799 family lipoprotein [Elusimicrobiota bacterium]